MKSWYLLRSVPWKFYRPRMPEMAHKHQYEWKQINLKKSPDAYSYSKCVHLLVMSHGNPVFLFSNSKLSTWFGNRKYMKFWLEIICKLLWFCIMLVTSAVGQDGRKIDWSEKNKPNRFGKDTLHFVMRVWRTKNATFQFPEVSDNLYELGKTVKKLTLELV